MCRINYSAVPFPSTTMRLVTWHGQDIFYVTKILVIINSQDPNILNTSTNLQDSWSIIQTTSIANGKTCQTTGLHLSTHLILLDNFVNLTNIHKLIKFIHICILIV